MKTGGIYLPPERSPEAYARANVFLRHIKRMPELTQTQKEALRKKALFGDVQGAWAELERMTMEDRRL